MKRATHAQQTAVHATFTAIVSSLLAHLTQFHVIQLLISLDILRVVLNAAYGCTRPGEFVLTFDDGPGYGSTDLLFDMLDKYNVPAGFFLVGRNMRTASLLFQEEVRRGYETFIHTFSHPALPTLTQKQIYEEMFYTTQLFTQYSCRRPTLMRPPFGEIDAKVREVVYRMGSQAVIWQVDTLDWQDAKDHPEWVINNFTNNMDAASPGGIMLLQHDIYDFTVALVPQIIELVQSRGYKFTTVEKCLYGERYKYHPSFVFENKDCPANKVLWPTPTPKEPCPISDWSEWSVCSSNCGQGTQLRLRYTLPPGAEITNPVCRGIELFQQQPCYSPALCSRNCSYGMWSNWSPCTSKCGGGTSMSVRELLSGIPSRCDSTYQVQVCNTRACGDGDMFTNTRTATPTSSPSQTVNVQKVTASKSSALSLSQNIAVLGGGLGFVAVVVLLFVARHLKKQKAKNKQPELPFGQRPGAKYVGVTPRTHAAAAFFDGAVQVSVDGNKKQRVLGNIATSAGSAGSRNWPASPSRSARSLKTNDSNRGSMPSTNNKSASEFGMSSLPSSLKRSNSAAKLLPLVGQLTREQLLMLHELVRVFVCCFTAL